MKFLMFSFLRIHSTSRMIIDTINNLTFSLIKSNFMKKLTLNDLENEKCLHKFHENHNVIGLYHNIFVLDANCRQCLLIINHN